jgi:LPXTG-motif cell wall-anchored protein
VKRKLAKRHFLAVALVSCALIMVPAAANATEQPESAYVLVAWNATEGDIWNPAQTLAKSIPLAEPTLDALDDALPCGGFYQIDLYNASATTDALIAGGVLYGPSNPTEDLAHGAVEGDPWKFFKTADCAAKPEPHPYSDAGETFTCEAWTYWTKTGFYDLTLDKVANVWVENAEPTITATSQLVPTTQGERIARGCEAPTPQLAETGLSAGASWALVSGLLLLFIGGSLVAYRKRKEAK